MAEPASGNGRVSFAWVAGILVTLLLAIGGALFGGVRSDVNDLRATVSAKAEETAALRASVSGLQNQLTRIEAKLDRLVENGR